MPDIDVAPLMPELTVAAQWHQVSPVIEKIMAGGETSFVELSCCHGIEKVAVRHRHEMMQLDCGTIVFTAPTYVTPLLIHFVNSDPGLVEPFLSECKSAGIPQKMGLASCS
jgi:hypothetical protein